MKITKLTIKFFLIISLFASVALADGHMGGGGFADDGHMGGGGKTCSSGVYDQNGNCVSQGGVADDGQMGSGGFASDEKAVLDFIKGFLASLLG